MARKCDVSGAKTSFGKSRKHKRGKAGGISGPWSRKAPATSRKWEPNLREVRVIEDGKVKRVKVTMKIYKKLRQKLPVGKNKVRLAS